MTPVCIVNQLAIPDQTSNTLHFAVDFGDNNEHFSVPYTSDFNLYDFIAKLIRDKKGVNFKFELKIGNIFNKELLKPLKYELEE